MICPTPIELNDRQVPCGTCGICLKNRASEWTFKLHQEWKVSDSAHVVLLTYNDESVPWMDSPVDGQSYMALDKSDLQKFFKRLRKAMRIRTRKSLRYYAVGEYGGRGNRPHYHCILFNAGDEEIFQAWELKGESLGIVSIKPLRLGGLGYLTTYFMSGNDYPVKLGLPAQFAVMSRRPGIGSAYLTPQVVKWHKDGLKNYTVSSGGVHGRLPRYYRDKIFNKYELDTLVEKAKVYREEHVEDISSLRAISNNELQRMKNQKLHL